MPPSAWSRAALRVRGTAAGTGTRAAATRGAGAAGGAAAVVVLDDELVSVTGTGASVTGGVVAGGGATTGRTEAATAGPARPSDRLATIASAEAATTVTRAATRPVFTRLRSLMSGSTAATVWQTGARREYPSPSPQ